MLPMGRPRSRRKDLPTGLHFEPKWETYFYRAGRGEKRTFVSFGKVSREKAIREYVKLTLTVAPSQDGTVGELVDRYISEELPRRLRRAGLRQRQRSVLVWGVRDHHQRHLRPRFLRRSLSA